MARGHGYRLLDARFYPDSNAISGMEFLETMRFLVRGVVSLDLVLVAVVYVALTSGSVTGLLTGAVAGLIQDVVTRVPSSIIGIGGLAKTIVGFLAGVVGIIVIISSHWRP